MDLKGRLYRFFEKVPVLQGVTLMIRLENDLERENKMVVLVWKDLGILQV